MWNSGFQTSYVVRFLVALLTTVLLTLISVPVRRPSGKPFKIGVVMSISPAYSDLAGKYSVAAAQLAIEDFGDAIPGRNIERLTTDEQLKPALGSAIFTGWLDRENVSAIFRTAGSRVLRKQRSIER